MSLDSAPSALTSLGTDTTPRVTIVITPRERFSMAMEAFESVLANTPHPFALVYVDAGSPEPIAQRIAAVCRANGFDYVRDPRYLSPNQSRNIGWRRARTPFVAFLENDVVVAPGWLDRMMACADETGADIVAPLTCQGIPLHSEIHHAGGTFADDVRGFFALPESERRINEEHLHAGCKVSDVTLVRQETQSCEPHCMLVRRSVLERQNGLDENLLATKEHLDLSMAVWRDGGTVMFEPTAVVTYVLPNRHRPLTRDDWAFFALRWSPVWQRQSLAHFRQKWALFDDPYFGKSNTRMRWRINMGIARPFTRKLPVIGAIPVLARYIAAAMTFGLAAWARSLAAEHRAKAPPAAS